MSTNTVQTAPAVRLQSTRAPRRIRWGQVVLHIILIITALAATLPFVWVIFASFKNFKELVSSKDILPHVWTLNNYKDILGRVNFGAAFQNSIIAATTVTIATLFTSAGLGYVFAKYQFWGKEKLFLLLLATLMVPFAVVLVPLYITI